MPDDPVKEELPAEKTQPKKEPVNTTTEVLDDYAKNMWTNYQNDYIKQLDDICYNTDFPLMFNTVQVKIMPDDLLHADPTWVNGKFLLKRLSEYQKDYIEELKAKMLDVTRKLSILTDDMRKNPDLIEREQIGSLNEQRKKLDKTYYEESLPIMFKLQLETDTTPRPIVPEDKYRLEWQCIKFAVDAVHLSFGKALPKKAKASQNLYT